MRTVPGLTCGFAAGTQLAHAFSCGGSLLFDRRAGRLVVVPVVELVAALDPLPQTTLDQLAHGPLRVVAEPSGHVGRHEPVSEVSCGPAAGPNPQRHRAVRRVEDLRVVVEGVVNFEPGHRDNPRNRVEHPYWCSHT